MAIITEEKSRLFCSINRNEAKIIYPVIEQAIKQSQKKFEYFQDLLEGGEASDRQQDKRIEYEDRVVELNSIKECMDYILSAKNNY